MRRLFLFRPEPGASRTAGRARELGLDPAIVPLFEIAPLAWEAPDPAQFDAILLTSANAVHHAGEGLRRLRGLPVHAVGETSAAAAREAGFDVATTGDHGIERLLSRIDTDMRLLHLCGEDRRPVDGSGHQIVEMAVYRAKVIPQPAGLQELAGQAGAVHSPRAASRLAQLVEPEVRATVRLAAISAAAAEAAGTGWERLETAESPEDVAVLACAARLCEKP